MTDMQVNTIHGSTVLDEAVVQAFKSSLRGPLLRPGDAGYDDARKIWNGMIDRRPAFIARCAGVADVIAAVNFGRTHELLVAVRGGGHSAAGHSMVNGGLVIDLSPMKSILVDPTQRTARAEPGATWADLDHETQAFGLATTGGTVSETGIAGLTLGGGLGWLMRKCGLTIDNLRSINLVTADGQFRVANATENADLFWGMRGGCGNFGIVTSFEYQLHPVGPVLAGLAVYPFEKAREVLAFYRDFASTMPDELCAIAGLLTSPEGVPLCVIGVCYAGPLEQGERVLQPLRQLESCLAYQIGPMTYCQTQTLLNSSFPAGYHYYQKTNFMRELSDEALQVLLEGFAAVPSPHTKVIMGRLGGAIERVAKEETPIYYRDAAYHFEIVSSWTDDSEDGDSEDGRNIQWARQLWDAMQPFKSDGFCLNHTGDEGTERVKLAYGPQYQRLLALKNKYDPMNMFRHNHNIKPTV